MTERSIYFISNLITYKPKSCIIRTAIICLIGIMCLFMTDRVASENSVALKIPYVTFSIGFIFITEFNVFLNFLISKYGNDTIKQYRISFQMILNFVIVLVVFSTLFPLFKKHVDNPILHLSVIFTCIFVVFIILMISLIRVVQTAYESQREVDKLYRSKIESDYQTLVEQVNPHFLFNNLSVLKSLILYDKDKAVNFVQNFTDTYRYILQVKSRVLVQLMEELDFLKSYIALHEERLGEGFVVKYDINKDALSKMVLPVSLQILVENALKHNIATKSEPLTVEITANAETVTVKNSLNKKDVGFSTHKGLNNIAERYRMLAEREIIVEQTETEFTVTLPLI